MSKKIQGISPEAIEMLKEHDWPGNVRELENAIERAVVVNRTGTIMPADLPLKLSGHPVAPHGDTLADMERQHILRMLESMNWNISRTSERLSIDRVTLYNKIEKYGLKRPE